MDTSNIPAILVMVGLFFLFLLMQIPRKRPYFRGVKMTEMPEGLSDPQKIKWIQSNYNGPNPRGLSVAMAAEILNAWNKQQKEEVPVVDSTAHPREGS